MRKNLLAIVFLLIFGVPSVDAQSLTFEWSFVTSESSPGPPAGAGHVVRGTISGLVEGDNDGSRLTVVVTETPNGQILGTDWGFSDPNPVSPLPAFVVTEGEVTFADAVFIRRSPAGMLFMGTEIHPRLMDGFLAPDHTWLDNSGGTTRFEVVTIRTPGDFNGDGIVGAADVDALSLNAKNTEGNLDFDLNSDGQVDQEDRRVWVEELAGTFFGDANLDKRVQFSDFLQLSEHFGESGGWSEGDFDGNGVIEFGDFLDLSSNFGRSRLAASVPEPSTAVLVAPLCCWMMCSKRGKRGQR